MESIRFHNGFTLVELMVVLAIIGTIMMIVLTGQGSFNKTFILNSTAYDIALTLRAAESYGISSRAVGATSNAGYGVHFSKSSPSSFIFFADTSPIASCTTPNCKPGDYIYSGGSDVLLQNYFLGNGITVYDFCALISGNWYCASNDALTSLDIVFTRPNPDAFIRANGVYSNSYESACIALTSPYGGSRFISVASSGEITAKASSCP